MHLRASKLHIWINQLPGDVHLSHGQLPNREIYEVSEAANHSKHISSESKNPEERHSPESHFHLVAFYSRILCSALFTVSSTKAIRSIVLYIYIAAVLHSMWTIIFMLYLLHHDFPSLYLQYKKRFESYLFWLWVPEVSNIAEPTTLVKF